MNYILYILGKNFLSNYVLEGNAITFNSLLTTSVGYQN